jgi:hypothetical protein
MARAISVEDILDLAEYEKLRSEMRRRSVALRKLRRVEVGERVTIVFENRETLLFQIHETMRDEGITDREALRAECDVYSSLLPASSELSATMRLHMPVEGNVQKALAELAGLDKYLSLCVGDSAITAQCEERDADMPLVATTNVRFPINHDLRDALGDFAVPVLLRIEHPSYKAEARLTEPCRNLIAEDLE